MKKEDYPFCKNKGDFRFLQNHQTYESNDETWEIIYDTLRENIQNPYVTNQAILRTSSCLCLGKFTAYVFFLLLGQLVEDYRQKQVYIILIDLGILCRRLKKKKYPNGYIGSYKICTRGSNKHENHVWGYV